MAMQSLLSLDISPKMNKHILLNLKIQNDDSKHMLENSCMITRSDKLCILLSEI